MATGPGAIGRAPSARAGGSRGRGALLQARERRRGSMSLLTPAWLLLAAMGLVVLILHVRRRRTFEMPSIRLWRMLDSGSLPRQRLRLPSPNLLLLLQLLIIALIALALARPLIGSRFAHEIVVLDASGSMRSRDVAPSRFDAAVAHLAAIAAGPLWAA